MNELQMYIDFLKKTACLTRLLITNYKMLITFPASNIH